MTLDDKFWDDPHKAQSFMKEKTALETKLEEYNILTQTLEDALTLHELAEESQDDGTLLEAESLITALEKQSRRAQLDSLLSGEASI